MLLYIGCTVASLSAHKSCKSLLLSCRYNHKLMELVHVVLKEVGEFAVREDRFLVSSLQQCTASAAHRYWETSNHATDRLACWASICSRAVIVCLTSCMPEECQPRVHACGTVRKQQGLIVGCKSCADPRGGRSKGVSEHALWPAVPSCSV